MKFRSQGEVWRNGRGNGRRGGKRQGQGSQELSDRAEGARGRLGRAEGLLVRTPLSPDGHRRGSQVKNLSGLWLAQAPVIPC